jgi:LuxR family transcriptional regulator, maltose regulon positive regulatory protein
MIKSSASRAGDRVGARVPSLVARPALFELLSASAGGGVTLVSAPAGSGKTVLLRSWIEHAGLAACAAWVSVDRGERDAQRFWRSVVQRLREVDGLESLIRTVTPTPDVEAAAIVQHLIAQLASLEQPVVLVIDDLHELHSPKAIEQLELLLVRRPSCLHVVLASRHDPQLGLHRLRLAGQLTEMRESELRFALGETRQLLAEAGIVLSEQSLLKLHERTEGWVAGLRLAAISLARHPAPERFVGEFAGSERTVAEYLLAEVLEQQPQAVRKLLLRTSILERVNGALADLLVGSSGSERVLQELEAANAFVVSLDAGRSWFRYHHLFTDLLRLELRRREPESVLALHRLAADWYAAHAYVIDAVRHAQTAGDWSHAAELLVGNGLTLWLSGEEATFVALIGAFPSDAPPSPELALLFGYREMTVGSLDSAAAYLALAERHATEVADDRKRRFDVALAVTRLTLARQRGDFSVVLEQVQALLGQGDAQTLSDVGLSSEARAAALMNLGIVELWAYHLDEAGGHLEQGLELAERIRLPYVQVGCLSHLAVLDAWHSFAEVRQRCAQALAVAEAYGLSREPVVCVALTMMALMDVAQARLETAQGWLSKAEATLRADVEPATALVLHRAAGMLHFSRGRLEQALATFRAAERLQSLLVTPHALTAQMREWLVLTLLRLGRVAEAREALAELSDEERHCGEARTAWASVCLVEGDPDAAVKGLRPVLDGSAPVLHPGSLVEALLVHAVARARLGDTPGTESDIERALEIAEPEAQIFPFVLVRPIELLQRHPRQRTAHAALLSDILDVLAGSELPPHATDELALREDLSPSELRVLGYLPSNLSAPEIADALCVSTSTAKTHMRQIYAKLDVHTRTEAVEQARRLGILGRSSRNQR